MHVKKHFKNHSHPLNPYHFYKKQTGTAFQTWSPLKNYKCLFALLLLLLLSFWLVAAVMEIRFALCLFLFHPISCFGVSAPFEHMWSRSSFVFIALQSYSHHLHQFTLGQNRLYIINAALTTTGLNHHSFIALGLWEMLNYSTCWVYTDSSRFCICIRFLVFYMVFSTNGASSHYFTSAPPTSHCTQMGEKLQIRFAAVSIAILHYIVIWYRIKLFMLLLYDDVTTNVHVWEAGSIILSLQTGIMEKYLNYF